MKTTILSLVFAFISLFGYSQKIDKPYTIEKTVVYTDSTQTDSLVSTTAATLMFYDKDGAFIDITTARGTVTFQGIKLLDKHMHKDGTSGTVYSVIKKGDEDSPFIMELVENGEELNEVFIVDLTSGVIFEFYISDDIQQ